MTTPNLQLRANLVCAFAHSLHAPVIGTATLCQDLLMDSMPVVAHAQAKRSWLVNDLNFNVVSARMSQRVENRLASNAVGFFLNQTMQFAHASLHDRLESYFAALWTFFRYPFEGPRQVVQ